MLFFYVDKHKTVNQYDEACIILGFKDLELLQGYIILWKHIVDQKQSSNPGIPQLNRQSHGAITHCKSIQECSSAR